MHHFWLICVAGERGPTQNPLQVLPPTTSTQKTIQRYTKKPYHYNWALKIPNDFWTLFGTPSGTPHGWGPMSFKAEKFWALKKNFMRPCECFSIFLCSKERLRGTHKKWECSWNLCDIVLRKMCSYVREVHKVIQNYSGFFFKPGTAIKLLKFPSKWVKRSPNWDNTSVKLYYFNCHKVVAITTTRVETFVTAVATLPDQVKNKVHTNLEKWGLKPPPQWMNWCWNSKSA